MFDIHRPFFDPEDGEIDWQRVEELVELFFDSPEGEQFDETDGDWVSLMFEYSLSHLGVELPGMSRGDMEEVLFSIFPRKVSTEPESAPGIVRQLRAFWRFLHRQFSLRNAAEIVDLLDSRAEARLHEELADSSNFGMAKSFFMMGQQAGFDMTTQEGMDAFMIAYNSRLLGGMPNPGVGMPPFGPPEFEDDYWDDFDEDDEVDEEEREPRDPFEGTGLTPKQRAEARKKKSKAQKQAKKKKRK